MSGSSEHQERSIVAPELYLEDKHADIRLYRDVDWSCWWMNTPVKGQCLSVEYIPSNYPALTVVVSSDIDALKAIEKSITELGFYVS